MKAKRKPATKAKRKPAARATPGFYRELGHAYRDQEGDLGDLLTMAKITARAAMGDEEGEKIFTAYHLLDMIDEFRQKWLDRHTAAS
jgi:hypothetical protein